MLAAMHRISGIIPTSGQHTVSTRRKNGKKLLAERQRGFGEPSPARVSRRRRSRRVRHEERAQLSFDLPSDGRKLEIAK